MAETAGDYFIDVGLRFDKFNKDMDTLKERLKKADTASFAAGTGTGAASTSVRAKAMKEETKEYDKQIKAMHEILGIKEKQASLDKENLKNMGFVDRMMHSLGAKNTGKTGMMGAQLSYAAQDFVTGLSMGNLNMALMGASNNLGMMAMQISSAAAAWTTLGLVAIPLAVTAFKAFGMSEDAAKKKEEETKRVVDELNRSFQRRHEILDIERRKRAVLTREELDHIKGAGAANQALNHTKKEAEEKEARRLDLINETAKANEKLLGENVRPPMMNANQEAMMRAMLQRGGGNQTGTERAHIQMAGLDPDTHRIIINKENKLMIVRVRTQEERKRIDEEITKLSGEKVKIEADQIALDIDIKALKKRQADEAAKEVNFMTREANAGANRFEQRRIQIDKAETEAERKVKEEGLDKIVSGQVMSAEEVQKKAAAIDEEAERKIAAERKRRADEQHAKGRLFGMRNVREMEAFEKNVRAQQQRQHNELGAEAIASPGNLGDQARAANAKDFANRRLKLQQDADSAKRHQYAGLVGGIDADKGRRLEIAAGLRDKIREIQESDLSDAEKKRRIKLAGGGAMAALGELGPKTGFAGIAELSKQMQMNITSNPMLALTKDINTSNAAMAKYLQSIVTDGLKLQNGGFGP